MKELLEKLKTIIIEPQKKILDDMEDETGMNQTYESKVMDDAADLYRKDWEEAEKLYNELKNLTKEELEIKAAGAWGVDDWYRSKPKNKLIQLIMKNKLNTVGADYIQHIGLDLNESLYMYAYYTVPGDIKKYKTEEEAKAAAGNEFNATKVEKKIGVTDNEKLANKYQVVNAIKEEMSFGQMGTAPTPVLKNKKSIKDLEKELKELEESLNDIGFTGIDDTIIQWLDKLNFKSTNTKEGYKYQYSGNYTHIIFYSKKPSTYMQYKVFLGNKKVYENTWQLESYQDAEYIFHEIARIFEQYE